MGGSIQEAQGVLQAGDIPGSNIEDTEKRLGCLRKWRTTKLFHDILNLHPALMLELELWNPVRRILPRK